MRWILSLGLALIVAPAAAGQEIDAMGTPPAAVDAVPPGVSDSPEHLQAPRVAPGRSAPGGSDVIEPARKRASLGLTLLRGEAERGNANAQLVVGVAYLDGIEVEQDAAAAAMWLQRAADEGLAEARYALGLMYLEGLGVEKSEVEAARLWRLAADQRLGAAQVQLGLDVLRRTWCESERNRCSAMVSRGR